MKDRVLEVLIVRHGQTNHNINRILQGHLDTPLNSSGQDQAVLLGKYWHNNGTTIDAVFASDLQRVVTTTNLIVSQLGLTHTHGADEQQQYLIGGKPVGLQIPVNSKNQNYSIPVHFTFDLRERSLGELESMPIGAAYAKANRESKTFSSYGETSKQVMTRIRRIWSEIIDQALKHPHWQRVLVVTHGGAISRICADLVNTGQVVVDDSVPLASLRVPPNTSVTKMIIPLPDPRTGTQLAKGRLVEFGKVDHLKAPIETFQDEQ